MGINALSPKEVQPNIYEQDEPVTNLKNLRHAVHFNICDNKSSNDMHSIFAFDLLKNLFKIMAKAANLSRPLKDVGKLYGIMKYYERFLYLRNSKNYFSTCKTTKNTVDGVRFNLIRRLTV